MTSPSVVIPMAGYGERFRVAGYDTYKPFILVKGKPMIDYVIDAFPQTMEKYIIVNPSLVSEEQRRYLLRKPHVTIIDIDAHKQGPAYSILRAADALDLDGSFFISYSDHYWTWDFAQVEKVLHYDGVVFTRRGFHPHMIKDNFSAFCLADATDPRFVGRVKEKGSFTDNWMEEPHSMGVYYFQSGHVMIDAIRDEISQGNRAAGEFYPSHVFNQLIAKGKKIYMHDVDFYIHFGVPAQLEDFNRWSAILHQAYSKPQAQIPFTSVLHISNSINPLEDVSKTTPRMQLDVCGKPLYEFVAESFGCSETLLLSRRDEANHLSGKFKKILLDDGEGTRFEELVGALSVLKSKNNVFVSFCDGYGVFEKSKFAAFVEKQEADVILFTFPLSLTQRKLETPSVWASCDGSRVRAVYADGSATSLAAPVAPFYWVRSSEDTVAVVRPFTKDAGESTVVDFLRSLLANGKLVAAFALDYFQFLDTADEYKEQKYWEKHKNVLL